MNEIYVFGPFTLDVRERRLTANGRPIHLRPKIFDTLCALVEHRGRLVEKDELMRHVWPDTVVEENNLALNIAMLRRALRAADPKGKWIETVTGRGYRFLGERPGAEGPGAVAPPPGTPGGGEEASLLEREAELGLLRKYLQLALQGERQFVCISGNAGIGKTALVRAFVGELGARDGSLLVGIGQCVERSGEGEAYMPVLEAVTRLCGGIGKEELVDLLAKHAPTWLAQIPSLMEPGSMPELRERILGFTRGRMLRELAEGLEAIASRQAVVLVLEDLHWADPSTLEMVSALARRQEPARILLIGTNRARDGGQAGRELEALTQELELRGQCLMVRPRLLSEEAIIRLAARTLPSTAINGELASAIREKTSGNPLFAQALIDYWARQGAGSELPQGIPRNLEAMIERKLEGLPRADQDLLECASVAGMNFHASLVAAVAGGEEEEVEERLWALAEAGALVQPDADERNDADTFAFAHSLYEEVLYARIPPVRKARLHRRAGQQLEKKLGSNATQRGAELADHFLKGREPERALAYLEAAAGAALQRSAPREAAVHLRRALEVLQNLPKTGENREREFRVLAMFAPTVIATEGFSAPEAEPSYARAFQLGKELGDMERAYPVLLGRAFLHELRGEYFRTEELLNRELALPEAGENSLAAVHADSLMACSLFHQGKFAGALERAEHAFTIYDPRRDRELLAPFGEDPSIACRAWAALSWWFLGFPDRARLHAHRLVDYGGAAGYSFALSTATMYAAHVHQLRREPDAAAHWAERTLRLAGEQGYLYNVAFAKGIKGWACRGGPEDEEGLELLREGLELAETMGARLDQPYLMALLAEVLSDRGEHREALETIAAAQSLVTASRAFFYEAELYRLRGQVVLRAGAGDAARAAEEDFRTAITVARRQGAQSLELRAANDLARLIGGRGEKRAACEVLRPVYGSFVEGKDTADLRDAADTLHRLEGMEQQLGGVD